MQSGNAYRREGEAKEKHKVGEAGRRARRTAWEREIVDVAEEYKKADQRKKDLLQQGIGQVTALLPCLPVGINRQYIDTWLNAAQAEVQKQLSPIPPEPGTRLKNRRRPTVVHHSDSGSATDTTDPDASQGYFPGQELYHTQALHPGRQVNVAGGPFSYTHPPAPHGPAARGPTSAPAPALANELQEHQVNRPGLAFHHQSHETRGYPDYREDPSALPVRHQPPYQSYEPRPNVYAYEQQPEPSEQVNHPNIMVTNIHPTAETRPQNVNTAVPQAGNTLNAKFVQGGRNLLESMGHSRIRNGREAYTPKLRRF